MISREHTVKKHAVSTGRNEPVYFGDAKQRLPKYTILGECTLDATSLAGTKYCMQ